MPNPNNSGALEVLMSKMEFIKEKIDDIGSSVTKIETRMEEKYVSKAEFLAELNPIKKIAYGLVGIVLIAFAGALVSLVFIR